jgi:signal transduction histidine kinase
MKNRTSSEHLGWVVLLLTAAVILPTVCLLWFMTTAVRNERLAMRQKLEDIYQNRLKTSAQEKLGADTINRHTAVLMSDGFLVYDSSGKLTYPAADVKEDSSSTIEFALAFQLEFKNNDPNKAFAEYCRIAEAADKNSLRIDADISQARCLRKLNRTDDAIAILRVILSRYDNSDSYLRAGKCRAHLLLLELASRAADKNFTKDLSDTFDYALSGMTNDNDFAILGRVPKVNEYIPSALQVFMLQKCIAYAQDTGDSTLQQKCNRAQWLIDTVSTSIQTAERYPKPVFADSDSGILVSTVICLDTKEPLYGVYQRDKDALTLMIFTPQHIISWLNPFLDDMQKLPSICSIYDPTGKLVADPSIPSGRKPFIKTILPDGYFTGWTVALYIDNSAFETAAGRQRLIYIWSSVLVIGLMMGLVFLAGREILHQARLNTMKNNFVATVTHELKTPLSSMRLLVDTLLDGNYTNQQQCREYLELISRENHRLSRMIDSFLTFSRMERGKQVFDMAKCSPSEIAATAVEAVQTKFNAKKCGFSVTVDDGLPSMYADKDAMVTVLVNLLDNACKYSGDDKKIDLKVFKKDNCLCFSVTDNGIGMTRRQSRRIFDKFYQVDTSLARRAEGCGLGLSIVKYIVDAHNGTIDVESKIGNGSVFIIKIPTVMG